MGDFSLYEYVDQLERENRRLKCHIYQFEVLTRVTDWCAPRALGASVKETELLRGLLFLPEPTPERLVDFIYGHLPDGGPDCALNNISVFAYHLRKKLLDVYCITLVSIGYKQGYGFSDKDRLFLLDAGRKQNDFAEHRPFALALSEEFLGETVSKAGV